MQKARDPILWLGAALVLVTALHGVISTAQWIGQPFPGFLLLENRVVASAGLTDWPAGQGGEIFQHELVAVEGLPLASPQQLEDRVRSLPIGAPVTYLFRSGERSFERVVRTRSFAGIDYILLFGAFFFCGIGLTGVALVIRFLRRRDPAARGVALSLWLIGMWTISLCAVQYARPSWTSMRSKWTRTREREEMTKMMID